VDSTDVIVASYLKPFGVVLACMRLLDEIDLEIAQCFVDSKVVEVVGTPHLVGIVEYFDSIAAVVVVVVAE
jgi:hypothetical protein